MVVKYGDNGDGQDRYYTLLAENYLHCIFTHTNMNESVGWCRWVRDDKGIWSVADSSRGEGIGVARKGFCNILDEVHLQLIAEKELL